MGQVEVNLRKHLKDCKKDMKNFIKKRVLESAVQKKVGKK